MSLLSSNENLTYNWQRDLRGANVSYVPISNNLMLTTTPENQLRVGRTAPECLNMTQQVPLQDLQVKGFNKY